MGAAISGFRGLQKLESRRSGEVRGREKVAAVVTAKRWMAVKVKAEYSQIVLLGQELK